MKTFSARMQNHLVDFKEKRQYLPPTNPRKRWEYVEIADNLYPPIRNGFLQYAYDASIDFHDYARHVRSSQTFCFNLFYPLVKQGNLLTVFAEKLGLGPCDLTDWHFEYQPEEDYLGEWQGSEKPIDYITSVDVALFFRKGDGVRGVVLCEVKFTEAHFSKCGGYGSNGNQAKDFCGKGFALQAVPERCYLVNKKGRRYFELTRDTYENPTAQECPFRDNNQCQRNHAFGKALVSASKVDEAYFGLVYHDDNEEILKEWRKYRKQCRSPEQSHLFEVRASEIVSVCADETLRRYFAERYLIRGGQQTFPADREDAPAETERYLNNKEQT